jgi:hypothetical protein
MKTLSFGCSLTRGTDLSDINTASFEDISLLSASLLTWPALVAQRLNSEYRCFALGGAGNLCIADRVLHHMPHYPDDLFIINWSFIDRFDYSDPQGRHFGNGSLDYKSLTPGSSEEVAQYYYRHLHSEFRDKITSLMYMKTVLDALISNKRKFLMTSVDPVLFCERWHCPPHVMQLQQSLRPHIVNFEGKNFLDWARHRGFEISSSGHPLEQAHAAAAELMLPVAQSLV